jgi:hypothetical protein
MERKKGEERFWRAKFIFWYLKKLKEHHAKWSYNTSITINYFYLYFTDSLILKKVKSSPSLQTPTRKPSLLELWSVIVNWFGSIRPLWMCIRKFLRCYKLCSIPCHATLVLIILIFFFFSGHNFSSCIQFIRV